MASTKAGWPLLYGGWKSYREWADNGFVPKEAAKRRGRHEGPADPDGSEQPEDSRPASGQAAGQATGLSEPATHRGGAAGRAPVPPVGPAHPGAVPPVGPAHPGAVPPAAPRASPGYFAAPAPDPFAPRPDGAQAPAGARPRREPAPFYVQQAMPPAPEPARPRSPEPPPPAALRPYVMTSGRTRTRRELAIHALVSTTGHGHAAANRQLPEQRAICLLCRDPRSVAEVAAALDVPLGVARVLIDDLAHQGLVVVHGLEESGTSLQLLGRVLDGLRRL